VGQKNGKGFYYNLPLKCRRRRRRRQIDRTPRCSVTTL